jgi:hypothetical protein
MYQILNEVSLFSSSFIYSSPLTHICAENVYSAVKSRLSQVSEEEWESFDFSHVLLKEVKPEMENAPKTFMTILRHALSAMKVDEDLLLPYTILTS